ncbi:hypothetical protein, partial [Antrihabitans spumae]
FPKQLRHETVPADPPPLVFLVVRTTERTHEAEGQLPFVARNRPLVAQNDTLASVLLYALLL